MSDVPDGQALPQAAREGVSIIVPAFNEEAILERTVSTLHAAFKSFSIPFEIIIVDDGSTDRTAEIARALAACHAGEVLLQSHDRNLGIGAAYRTGFARARYPMLTTCAADIPYGPEDIRPFLAALGRADTIVGVRVLRAGYGPLMRFNSWLYMRLVHAFFGLPLRDVNWTCFYRADLLRRVEIRESGIPMLLEVLVKLRDLGGSFFEVEVHQPERMEGVASASRFRVMGRTAAGFFRVWRRWRRERPRGAPPGVAACGTKTGG